MDKYASRLPVRRFDNLQFVDYHSVMKLNARNPQAGFAAAALAKIPRAFSESPDLLLQLITVFVSF